MKTLFVVAVVILWILTGCSADTSGSAVDLPTEVISGGVIQHGCCRVEECTGVRLENTNDHSVRIIRKLQGQGREITEPAKCLDAGASLTFKEVSSQHLFLVFKMDGSPIGVLSAECPKSI